MSSSPFTLTLATYRARQLHLALHLLSLLAGRTLSLYFGMSRITCMVWSDVSIILVFFLSTVPSDVSLRVASFILIVFHCSFGLKIFTHFSCLYIFACVRIFLICVSNLISHSCLGFLFVSFSQSRFYHRLISPLHRLIRLIPDVCWDMC